MSNTTNPQMMKREITAKYTIKDSVFSDLFGDKKYLLKLYQSLHPEDVTATMNDLKNVTIKNVLVDAMYNDLGFMVGDRLVVLAEAQSTWSVNIIIRSFLYLAQSCRDYLDQTGQSLYSSKKVKMPQPELYVIFTGNRVHKPEQLSFTEEFFGGNDSAVEIKVKVIYGGDEENIINQYILFTKIYNGQMKLYGRTEKAVTETIRICKNRNVLREYLESREKEVHDIMFSLFDDEYIMKMFMISENKRVEEETTEKVTKEVMQEAKKEALKEAQEKALKTAEHLLKGGKLSAEEIAACVSDISLEQVKELEEKLKQKI